MLKYTLKKEIFFEDGNSISTDIILRQIKIDSRKKIVKLETISEHNVKRIFWADKENLKKI